jgi:MFS transporter, DHA1 family, multidrug resistance protein
MGFIGGNQVNIFLLRKFTSQQIFLAALLMQVLTGMLFFAGMRGHVIGLRAALVLFFVFLSCIGFTYPNAAALGLARFSRDVGRASALLGFLQMGTGALISMGIGLLGADAVVSLLSSTALVALAIFAVGRVSIGKMVESEESETALMH